MPLLATIIHLAIGYPLFFLLAVFCLYIPGVLLLDTLSFDTYADHFERNVVAWFSGIALFLLGIYISAYLGINDLYLYALFVAAFIWLARCIARRTIVVFSRPADAWQLGIVAVGTLAFAAIMFFSGLPTIHGTQFFSVNSVDGLRHVAYIADQMHHFPPQRPDIAGENLRGFHYFYDFMLSRFALYFGFSVEDLYFRYFPLLISALYGLSAMLLIRRITKHNAASRFSLFLLYFSQSSTAFLIPFYKHVNLIDDAIIQPLGLVLNPFTVLALGLLFCGLSLLPRIRQSWRTGLLVGILFGVLSQTKVYCGIIAISCLLTYCLFLIIRYKITFIRRLSLPLATTAAITAFTFFPNNLGAGGLVFRPLLFYEHYMQTELFSSLHWATRLLVYGQAGQVIKIGLLYIVAIVLFIVVNTGIRLVAFVQIKHVFTKTFWQQEMNIILATALAIPLLIGSLFVQSVSVFDTVQFFWITLVFLCFPAGLALARIYEASKHKQMIIVIILVATLPQTLAMQYRYIFSAERITITPADAKVFAFVAKYVPSDAFITVLPPTRKAVDDKVFPSPKTPIFAALSKHKTYYEPGGLPIQDEEKFASRAGILTSLQTALVTCVPGDVASILTSIGSPYVLTVGTYDCLEPTLRVIHKFTANEGAVTFYHFLLNKH